MKEAKNNSYETEPSSSSSVGSGHSLSCAHNDYLEMVDVENIKLPILLEPRNYEYEKQNNIDATFMQQKENIKSCKNVSAPSSAYKSSQESPFAGFRETPLKALQEQRFFYEDTSDLDATMYDNDENEEEDVIYVQTFPVNSSETAKKNIYDTIISENSCNAVDIPLTSQNSQPNSEKIQAGDLHSQISDLSFNGKIKALDLNCSKVESTSPKNTKNDEDEILDLNGSSFFKSSMSPDLFADEDDDDNDGDKNEISNNINNVESLAVEHQVKTEVVVENIAQNLNQDVLSKNEQHDTSANRSLNCPTESSFADEPTLDCFTQNENNTYRLYRENCKRERDLLRRIRKCLSGLPPPPSMTIPQVDLIQMVVDRKADILNFLKGADTSNSAETSSKRIEHSCLFKPTHSLDEAKNMPWRDILGVRQHGLSYNLSTASEHCEYLSLSVVERFVGAETTSSYRRSPSSAKKRNLRVKLLPQSPGNRLSHLAKRRAIFSSANLATTSQRSATALGPQIVIDKRKSKSRRKATPKRKTPGSRKKTRKTPSSSARKLQFCLDHRKPAPTRETSKRALFQSPMEIQQQQQQQNRLIKPLIKPEIATKVEKSKRALFSPEATTYEEQIEKPTTSAAAQRSESLLLKRKRNENNDDNDDMEGLCMPSKKLLRCDASSLTPRALKIKSQSFCIGAGSSDAVAAKFTSAATFKNVKRNLLGASSSNNSFQSLSSAGSSNSLYSASHGGSTSSLFVDKKLQRAQSDMAAASTSLTENQRKKLLWAVSQALQEKKISTQHENFKPHATVLARVVRRIFQEFYQKTSTSNSETLLRLAKKYVFYVISGRTCDDIYTQVRAEEAKRLSTSRLTGYIGPEEYQQRKQQQLSQQLSQSSLVSSFSSFSSSICGSMQNLLSIDDTCSQPPTQNSQLAFEMNQTNQSSFNSLWSSKNVGGVGHKQRPIETNASLQNSSSKSNLGSLALRENSGQKNFTGKDQRNISPYAKGNSGLKHSANVSYTDSFHTNASAKAKRQISFDS